MTDPTAELPTGVPEAELLEQRATANWPEPQDEVTVPERVTDRMVDEGDLLEQAQPAGTWTGDDDHPHE